MEEIKWSPGLMIRLLEIHTRPTEFTDCTDRQFLDLGLIEHSSSLCHYTTTERGRKMIDMWGSTPLPVSKWIDPREVSVMPFPQTLDELKAAGYVFKNYATCKGCGADIEWWLTPKGKSIPMEPMDRGVSPASSHWSNCSEADSFRKPK